MKGKRFVSIGASLLLALAFSLIFCEFNTPLGPSIGSDNAIYLTMGTAIAQGYAPYTEIFDHKGPLLFLLQALPQAIAGGYSTLAVFAMEALFLFACLRVLCDLARQLRAPEFSVQIVYLALTASLFGGGNLTEEYTSLFTLMGLDLALRAFGEQAVSPRRLTAYAAAMGAAAMLSLLLRANNALPLLALAMGLTAFLLGRRAWAALFRCALGFTLGLLLCALPVVLWLAARGALQASFYGSILHNLMYAQTAGDSRLYMLLHSGYGYAALLMAALACAGAFALPRERRALRPAMVAAAAAAGLAAFTSHKYYDHYLILGAPVAAMGVAALLGRFAPSGAWRMRRAAHCVPLAVVLVSLLWLGTNGLEANHRRQQERADWPAFTADAQALYAQVPEQERESFMAYRVEPRWYVAAKALPCMRFYFLQEILAQADPAVMEEIVGEFESDPPRWLVIYYNREFGPPYDARVAAIFKSDYEFVDARGQYQLLRLKEAGT